MGKKQILIIIVIITTLFLYGCMNNNIYQNYLKALENTSQVKSLHSLVEFQLKMDFGDTNLSSEEKKNLEMYSNTEGTLTIQEDREKDQFYMDGHVDTANMGFDIKVYDQKDEIIVLLPVFSKYMILDKEKLQTADISENPLGEIIPSEDLEKLWRKNVRPDNIKKMPDKIVSTNEGDIKATAFQITLTEDEIKGLSKSFTQIFFSSPKLKETMETAFQKAYKDKGSQDFSGKYDRFMEEMQKSIERMKIVSFQYTGAYDKDYYMVDEQISYVIEMPMEYSEPISIAYSLHIKNWNINKPIEFNIPQLDDRNSFTLDKLDENTPKLLEKFIKDPTDQ
ncbi:MAG: hypothetical protein ACOYVK_19915 [Bacillota bacterium]